MTIFEKHNLGLEAIPRGDTFHEQWVSGTYIVSGVFQLPCHRLDLRDIQEQIPRLFEALRKTKSGWWPKGICGYFAIPIYTADTFEQTVVEWVHSRPKYKYAMWHEPVLYDRVRNVVEMNNSWGNDGSAFRIFLFDVIHKALHGLARKERHATFPLVNGRGIAVELSPCVAEQGHDPNRKIGLRSDTWSTFAR